MARVKETSADSTVLPEALRRRNKENEKTEGRAQTNIRKDLAKVVISLEE